MNDYQPSKRSTFMYFAYGSNLWTNRIRLQNPSAVRKTTATLKGYRLDFYHPHNEPTIWNGASATVVDDEDHVVWGTIWEIDLTHMASLDCQEGVHINKYVPLIKDVHTANGEVIECRLYQMTELPLNKLKLKDGRNPLERKPSKSYLTTIIRGAEESKLPAPYVEFLKNIVHNGRDAHPELIAKLELHGNN